MGVAYGLAAALSWGAVDVLAATAARRGGAMLPVVLGFQLFAGLTLVVVAAAAGALEIQDAEDLGYFALVGLVGACSYLVFYRALAIGPISVVSPVASGYAAVTVLLAVLIVGERLTGAQAAAVLIVFAGVALASADIRRIRRAGHVQSLALVLAILAMALFGGYVLAIAERADDLGWVVPVLLARLASTAFIAGAAAARRELRLPRTRTAVIAIAIAGILDSVGFLMFSIGATEADTSIVAAASAPYAVVPIIAGVVRFHERPSLSQWTGIAGVILGVVMLGLVSS